MENVAVLGAGSWGTALAIVLGDNGHKVKLWTLDQGDAHRLNLKKENIKFLKGCKIPPNVHATSDLGEALFEAKAVVISVPSHAVRSVLKKAGKYIHEDAFVVNSAKGFELDSLKRLSHVIKEELPRSMHDNVAVLSGPSHAEEVGARMPTAVVAASKHRAVAEFVQDIFINNRFRVYTNPDIAGVELAGALKNVIALAAGMADGLGFGDNTKSALMTRGIVEIARLGVCMKAHFTTFAGLTGIGDLIVTCTSMHSRNRRAGIQLGQGRELEDILKDMGMVVEGVKTTKAAYLLASKHQVEMPITEQVHRVLYQGLNPADGVNNLMGRDRTKEMEELALHGMGW